MSPRKARVLALVGQQWGGQVAPGGPHGGSGSGELCWNHWRNYCRYYDYYNYYNY